MFEVTLEKNMSGSLGIKIAGGSGGHNKVYIKALVSNPALSCPNIRPLDRLISASHKGALFNSFRSGVLCGN